MGVWRLRNGREEFIEVETESIKFTNYLVRDVTDLKATSNVVSVSLDEFEKFCLPDEEETRHNGVNMSRTRSISRLSGKLSNVEAFQEAQNVSDTADHQLGTSLHVNPQCSPEGVIYGYDEVQYCDISEYAAKCQESGETVESIEVLLSVKKATEGPEGPQWVEAINKENSNLSPPGHGVKQQTMS